MNIVRIYLTFTNRTTCSEKKIKVTNMKSRVSISEHSINVRTPILGLMLLSIAGSIILAAGIFILNDIPHIDHLLIGAGIIILFGGLFALFYSKYYKILINEEPGYLSLVESTGWDITPLKIPFRYFNEIVIQYLVNREKPEYEIMLKSRTGSLMLVARFYSEAKALSFSNKFEKAMGLKVTRNSVIPDDIVDKRHPFNPYAIVLPDKTSIKTTERRDSVGLVWKIKYHPLQLAFMFVIYYGILHIFHFSAVPSGHISHVAAIIIYTILGILLSLLITLVISSLTGSYYLIISRESIRYFHKIFGKKYGEQEMKKKDIALVRSSIELGTEQILIASKKGISSLNNLIRQFSHSGNESSNVVDISDMRAFKEEMIYVNAATLKLSEKLFIEQFIMKNM